MVKVLSVFALVDVVCGHDGDLLDVKKVERKKERIEKMLKTLKALTAFDHDGGLLDVKTVEDIEKEKKASTQQVQSRCP